MPKRNDLQKRGFVLESLPSTTFKIKLEDGREILAHLSGRLRLNHIRILAGDEIIVELSPYDERRGRIIQRL